MQLVFSCMSSLRHCGCHSCVACHAPFNRSIGFRGAAAKGFNAGLPDCSKTFNAGLPDCSKGFNAGLPDCSKAKQPARRQKAAAATKQASAEASLQPPTAKRYRPSQLSLNPRLGHGASRTVLITCAVYAVYLGCIRGLVQSKPGTCLVATADCTFATLDYSCSWLLVMFCIWFLPQHQCTANVLLHTDMYTYRVLLA